MISLPESRTLDLRGIEKRYGITRALNGLDLTIASAEILGIAGPNGAGKSTLVRLLAGEETADAGAMTLCGSQWMPQQQTVAVVHQEPVLFPNLTVAENILVGRERFTLGKAKLDEREVAILEELGIGSFAGTIFAECSLVVKQLTAIARALVYDAEMFLFDEPNSALTEEESGRLFEHMHALAEGGRFVVLVSHRLAEVVAHANRVAVILEGRCAALLSGASVTEEAIAQRLVVGDAQQDSATRTPARKQPGESDVLRLRGWSHGDGAFHNVDLTAKQGKITALIGVEGSGARELVASIAGFEPARGELEAAGYRTIQAASRALAFLPADRKASLFPNHSVARNLVARLGRPLIAGPFGYLRLRKIARLATELIATFRIRAESPTKPIASLSGGNQQKVTIAAAIAAGPRLLLLEEPTRGVDIASKAEIYRLLRRYVEGGNGILVFCTEVPEVFELADEVAVFDRGHVVRILEVSAYTDIVSFASSLTVSNNS